MKLYKLTDQKGQTRNKTQWGEGVMHTAPGTGELCTSGWLHAYTDPLLAVLMNPVHANIADPQLWEAEGEVGKADGTKVGCAELTTMCRMELPTITTEQRVRFALLCALAVYKEPSFVAWANDWLSGKDRTREAAARAVQRKPALRA